MIEPEPPSGWAGNTQPWALAQTHVILGEALYLGQGQEPCHSLSGQRVQLKTWLSKGLGTVHVGSLLLSLKAEHIQEGAAEGHSEQGRRRPTVCTLLGALCCTECHQAADEVGATDPLAP